jgi:glycosyltransferase involved in cell wall biosynthesis
MRILYVSHYYPPEVGAASARVHELAREWVKRDCSVTVLTGFPHYPIGKKRARDRFVLTRREEADGVDVVRSYVFAAANRGVVKRMCSYASFMLSAMMFGRVRIRRPDVVIATSPQLLCGVAGYALARSFGVPFVFEVRDLWPESILAVEAMRDSPFIRALKCVARHLYNHSDQIVTVGEGYRQGIHKRYGIPLDAMAVVRNGIDARLFRPSPRENEVRRQHGWGDRFVTMYVGTHGMAHGLRQVLETAKTLRGEPDKLFVFVGEGAEKDQLKRRAAEWQLSNVQFIDQQPKSRVPLYYAACDLGLVSLRATPLFQEVLPSKIFEYMGMERAVLSNVNGEAREVIESAGAGEYVPSEDVPAMVSAVRRLAGQPDRLATMGRRGRQYVLRNFDRSALAEEYLELLREVVARRNAEKPMLELDEREEMGDLAISGS